MQELTRIFDLLNGLNLRYNGEQEVFSCLRNGELFKVDALTYIGNAERLGCALQSAGIRKGDRIATLVSNRPEWSIIDMGILLAGAVQVPVYPTLGTDNFRFVFNDSAICLLFVDDETTWQSVRPIIADIPSLQETISIDRVDGLRRLNQWMEADPGEPAIKSLYAQADEIKPAELATIIYTSGTTGRPKGVMLSHSNIMSNLTEVSKIFMQNPIRKALSVLPLCHVYERIINYTYQLTGTSIHYVQRVDELRENLMVARPEMFSVVPRLLEKSFAAILQKGRNLRGFNKKVFFWAMDFGQKFEPRGTHSLSHRLKHKLADRLVYRKLRLAFGGRLNTIVSGGASLNPKIARVFWAAGIKVMEGYGLTETSPVIAVGNFLEGGVQIGTVGPVLPGVQVSFASDGEILCMGPNVMMGYFNRPERTAEMIDTDGWLHTGDIGRLVEGKFLQITDRKKEMFKTSGGKYVAPQVIENRLKESPFIEFVMVVGEYRNFPAAIIVPNFDHLKSWCKVKEIPYPFNEDIILQPLIINRIDREVAAMNRYFSRPEQIKAFKLVSDLWSIESGELSPTLKLRRSFLVEKYALLIEKMYETQD